MENSDIPGGPTAKRELHFFWMVDCSGSMDHDGKIQSLNQSIKESIPEMREVAAENPNAEIKVRAIKFSNGAEWHIEKPVSVEDFEWTDMEADGVTDMGRAFKLLANKLNVSEMPNKGLPPVLVLLSDGQPTDNYKEGLEELLNKPWGKKAVRISIAIGDDADEEVLNEFIGHEELNPLKAENSEELSTYIKWASTEVVKSASTGSSEAEQAEEEGRNVPLPARPEEEDVEIDPDTDVF